MATRWRCWTLTRSLPPPPRASAARRGRSWPQPQHNHGSSAIYLASLPLILPTRPNQAAKTDDRRAPQLYSLRAKPQAVHVDPRACDGTAWQPVPRGPESVGPWLSLGWAHMIPFLFAHRWTSFSNPHHHHPFLSTVLAAQDLAYIHTLLDHFYTLLTHYGTDTVCGQRFCSAYSCMLRA